MLAQSLKIWRLKMKIFLLRVITDDESEVYR